VDLASLLAARAKSSPERPAITFEGETRTFRQTQDRVERLAAVLHNGGVAAGDRVAYLGLNNPAILEVLNLPTQSTIPPSTPCSPTPTTHVSSTDNAASFR
jgi:non-ribosomal peptide synthetase component E (peptide arylation enzyme)